MSGSCPDSAIAGLADEDRKLLVEALCALRDARGREWLAACHRADELGRRKPGLARLRLDELKRLARRLGGRADHWMER